MLIKTNFKKMTTKNKIIGDKFLYKFLSMFILLFFIFNIFNFIPNISADPNDSWWDSNWSYRKELNIYHENIEANLTNYPLLLLMIRCCMYIMVILLLVICRMLLGRGLMILIWCSI